MNLWWLLKTMHINLPQPNAPQVEQALNPIITRKLFLMFWSSHKIEKDWHVFYDGLLMVTVLWNSTIWMFAFFSKKKSKVFGEGEIINWSDRQEKKRCLIFSKVWFVSFIKPLRKLFLHPNCNRQIQACWIYEYERNG